METMDRLKLAVEQEQALVWHDDPLRYPYLRQTAKLTPSRTRPIGRGDSWSRGGRVVGYATLVPRAPSQNNYWARRVFWCKQADRDGSRIPPAREAVHPGAIEPGILTPWLADDDLLGDFDPLMSAWLVARRRELGLGEGCAVSSLRRPPRT